MKNKVVDIIVLGNGGLAREFTDHFSSHCNILGYMTTCPKESKKFDWNGYLLTPEKLIDNLPTRNLIIAIGSPKVKKKFHEVLSSVGFIFPKFIHNTAIVSESSFLDDGVIVAPMTIIGPNTHIGKIVYCNYHVGIGHNSIVGDYVQINPGAQIGGDAYIHSESLIGSNSILVEKTKLKNAITIGSGSVVLGTKIKAGTIAPIYSKYLPF